MSEGCAACCCCRSAVSRWSPAGGQPPERPSCLPLLSFPAKEGKLLREGSRRSSPGGGGGAELPPPPPPAPGASRRAARPPLCFLPPHRGGREGEREGREGRAGRSGSAAALAATSVPPPCAEVPGGVRGRPGGGAGGGGGRLPGRPLRPAGEAGSRGGGCGVGPWAAPPQGGCGASTGRSRRLLGCGTATGTGVGCRVLPLLGTPGRAPRSPASAAAPPADRGGQRRRPCSPRPRSWLGSFSPVKFCVPGEALFRVFSSSF